MYYITSPWHLQFKGFQLAGIMKGLFSATGPEELLLVKADDTVRSVGLMVQSTIMFCKSAQIPSLPPVSTSVFQTILRTFIETRQFVGWAEIITLDYAMNKENY